ncbi:hypothetical protein PFISCL1PPCAC_28104, partial [Pristionchus fissidentatus]
STQFDSSSRMNPIVLLALACSIVAIAARHQDGRMISPLVGPKEGMEHNHRNHHPSHGSRERIRDDFNLNDFNSEEFRREQLRRHNSANLQQSRQAIATTQSPVTAYQAFADTPSQQNVLPVVAEEGTGLIKQATHQPAPAIQQPVSEFPAPVTTTTQAPAPAPVASSSRIVIPEKILTCSTVRCDFGWACIIGNDGPVCVNNGNKHSTCDELHCSEGRICVMQQISSCSRLPCPHHPICVQAPTLPDSSSI